MLTCTGEYNETIQTSSILYNYNTCSHGDKYGIQNLCDGQRACSFFVFLFFFIILYCLTRLLTKHLRCPGKQK
jgi:hypothetical protein